MRSPAKPRRRLLHQLTDLVAADLKTGDYQALGQQDVFVITRAGDFDSTGCMETMPETLIRRAQSKDFSVDDVTVDHQHQPLDRAHEIVAAIAPAHALRNRQIAERADQHLGQQFGQRLAGLRRTEIEPIALIGFTALELIHLDPAGSGKSKRRARCVAILVKSRRQRRAAFFDYPVGLAQRGVL